jgi:membrane fusion protein, heavy metal efflux system
MKGEIIILAFAVGLASCSKPKNGAQRGYEVAAGPALIAMELAAQEHVGMRSEPARMTQLTEYLQVTGTVQPADSRVSEVRSLGRGRLLEVRVKVGDRVRAGQELARLDNLEAEEIIAQMPPARAELQRLKVMLAAQSRQAARNQQLAAIGAVPKKDYEQSVAEGQALEESIRAQEGVIAGLAGRLRRFGNPGEDPSRPVVTSIAAPFAGIVTKASSAPGEVVEPGRGLFTVADISQVWVQAEVYEKDLGRLPVGRPATIHVDTYPDEAFAGRVAYISDTLDPQTRTAKVRCEVDNAGARLKLDMFATIQLPTTFNRTAITVPADAVQQLNGKTVVFVKRAAAHFEAREIAVGKIVGGQAEVLSGLKEGEPVVVVGAFHLKSIVAGKELGEE